MTNDDSESPMAVPQAIHGQDEPSPPTRIEVGTVASQPRPSDPPETPTLPPGGTHGTRASEPATLPERHQTTLRHIHALETHSARLYEDNCRLVDAVNVLNDRLAFLGAPQNTQVLHLADLQEKLRTSEANRASIDQKYQDLLQCIPAGSVQQHITVELRAVRDAYASLDREYRLLADKYVRLKAFADTSRVAQQQPRARDPVPTIRSELRGRGQGQNSFVSPAPFPPPGSFQPFPHQREEHRRRSSEIVMAQPSLRPGTTPIATTWLEPLPTPPPSAPLSGNQILPTGFPVHASVPARSLPLPRHAQMVHDPHSLPGLPAATPSRPPAEHGASEQLKAAIHPPQPPGKAADMANNTSAPCGKSSPAPASSESSLHSHKRPSTELQTAVSSGGVCKKTRIEGEAGSPTSISIDSYPANKVQSSPASTDLRNDRKLSASNSDVRSYEDRVNLIFEKDADVENGVFCGLCLDRYEARMILEPPDVLIRPAFDFLVRHCMTMHPTVWQDLRRKAKGEQSLVQ